MPNISPDTNGRPTPKRKSVDAVVDHYETLMHRLIEGHAPDFTEVGITMAQAKVLYVVMAAGELRMSELAARLGIGSSSASGLADRLVELGLLVRRDDPADRRQVVVTTTPEAAALMERFRELNQRQLRELLTRLDPDELDVVDRSLDILGRAIDRADTTTDQREIPS
jgi:DNA-binding MarR family transcriptional regulator